MGNDRDKYFYKNQDTNIKIVRIINQTRSKYNLQCFIEMMNFIYIIKNCVQNQCIREDK